MELPEKGITGIYKITNPKGRVYIGQAKCVRKRLGAYIKLSNHIKRQPKLYNSLKKYKPGNHIFEIIHICDFNELNDLERYYQELYNSVEKGLNCLYTTDSNSPQKRSEYTKRKISLNSSNKISIIDTSTGCIYHSIQECNRVNSIDISQKMRGYSTNDTPFRPLNDLNFPVNQNPKRIDKKILNTETNEIFNSVYECARLNGFNEGTFSHKMRNENNNNTPFRPLNDINFKTNQNLKHNGKRVININTKEIYESIKDCFVKNNIKNMQNFSLKLNGKKENDTFFRLIEDE